MAKFSIFRDEDEDDEEFSSHSPKRRMTSETPPTPHPTESDYEIHGHDRCHQETGSEDDNHGDDDSESVDEPTKSSSIPVFLSDPDVLDCPICFNPVTVPVFQCNNEHIACASCCTKLANKCPSCCEKIGYNNNRCRAIEKVIDSVRVSCCYLKYGCKEKVIYCKKHEHEEICTYAPCSCPFLDCNFRDSPSGLSQHVGQEHTDFVVCFRYDSVFPVSVGMDEKFVVLQEERCGIMFVLNHGNTVTVRCIDPSLSKGRFADDIVLHEGDNSSNSNLSRIL